MNTLREALHEYLELRRGLGFKMHDAVLQLPRFVAFMEDRQAPSITIRSRRRQTNCAKDRYDHRRWHRPHSGDSSKA